MMALPRTMSCALAGAKAKSRRSIASLRDPGRDSQWAMIGRLAVKKQSGAKVEMPHAPPWGRDLALSIGRHRATMP